VAIEAFDEYCGKVKSSARLVCASLAVAAGMGSLSGCSQPAAPAAATPALPAGGSMSSVGTVAITIVDDTRRDRVDAIRARTWIAQLFYPITPARVTGVYADDPVLLDLLIAEKYYLASEPQLRAWASKPAAAITGAPPWTPAALPIVTISPGLGFARLNYAELAAALVARGYVVVVIDHPYIGYSRLPDGRILRADQDLALTSDNPADAMPAVRAWTRDISVTLDRIAAGAAQKLAPGLAADVARVTAAGHSIGGTAAVDACDADPRIHACLDFEGFLDGTEALAHGAQRPTLVTYSRARGRPPTIKPGEPDPADRVLAQLAQRGAPVWDVHITGGSHTSFSDAPDVLPQTLTHFGGEVMSAARSIALYTGLVDAFARAYAPGGGGDEAVRQFLATVPEARGRRSSAR
jgi:dienelactone hydrolase